MNIKSTIKKLQTALIQRGYIYKINTYQFFSTEPHDNRVQGHAETAIQEKEWGNVGERCGTAEYLFTGGSVEVVCGEVERGKGK